MTSSEDSRYGERLASLEADMRAVNRRVDDNDGNTKRELDQLRAENARLNQMDARIDRVMYIVLGAAAAVITAVVTGPIIG